LRWRLRASAIDKGSTISHTSLLLVVLQRSPARSVATHHQGRGWFPTGKDLNYEDFSWVNGKGHCAEMTLNDPLEGHSSVTVERIELNTANDGELIRGPWTFEFEVPDPYPTNFREHFFLGAWVHKQGSLALFTFLILVDGLPTS
jgi:hypothetical protein